MFVEYLIILFLPLFSSIYCGVVCGRGRYYRMRLMERYLPYFLVKGSYYKVFIPQLGPRIISISASSVTCFLSFYVFYQVGFLKNPYYLVLGT
jgi:hypothetical protein